MTGEKTGGCACGRVRYAVNGSLRPVVACHCRDCRRASGHFWAATRAHENDLRVEDHTYLRWYESSADARRGFCTHCGSSLFFDRRSVAATAIAAGSLDEPTHLTLVQHIFVAEAGDYYTLDDGLPQADWWARDV